MGGGGFDTGKEYHFGWGEGYWYQREAALETIA